MLGLDADAASTEHGKSRPQLDSLECAMPLTPENCGITSDHIRKIQAIAKEKSCFIFARLVNPDSTKLIEEGYMTKKLDIHAKSSNWGPMAGFICVDSDLSKVVDEGTEKIERNKHAVTEALRTSGVGQVQLTISPARAAELASKGLFAQRSPDIAFDATSRKGKKTISFRFTTVADGKYSVSYKKNGGAFQPLMVIGYRNGGVVKAVTADYDIFAICPHFRAPGFRLGQVTQVRDQGMEGVLSHFQRSIKDLINQRCGPPDVVNHGTELNNPFPENEPQIAMFPPGGDHRLVERLKLHQIFGDLTIRGFHVYVNQQWNAAFKTHIGAKMSRLQNPALRATLRLEYMREADFGGLTLDGYGGETRTAMTMQKFGTEVANNRATSIRPRWR